MIMGGKKILHQITISDHDGITYGDENELQIIEIQIICRQHSDSDYFGADNKAKSNKKNSKIDKHYYIYYTETDENVPKPMIFMNPKDKPTKAYKATSNCVSIGMNRGQPIKWRCIYPFTIYYGGTSIITTDKLGWPRPRQIIPYLKGRKIEKNWYETPDVWIVNNALKNAYKYFVSVYIPEEDIICVDDPEIIVPRPK
jgi:hypothetical protein